MKKTLPVIITLVGLSLLGLIILQASWLHNLVELQEQQISNKIFRAQYNVATELSKELYNTNSVKIPKQLQGLNLKDDIFANVLKPRLVSHQFSLTEVKEMIESSLKKEDIKKINYEFAIIDNKNESEMFTKDFEKTFIDSNNRKRFVYNITDAGTPYENLGLAQRLEILVPNFEKQVWGSLIWILIGSGLFTIIIFAAFYITVRTLFTQKKLSEIKSDFINNMTHEFKTPIATISLAVDALRNEKVLADVNKINYFSGIIKEENKRMNNQVETILQAALLEKKELQFNTKQINANILIATVLDNYGLQLNEKNGKCCLELDAQNDLIDVDELHFANVISNLIDNAIKYSKENLIIKIKSYNNSNSFYFEVEDNGIGMSKDTVKNVFEKFYRAHTGNVHNVKGFGLGMNYVKTVISAMQGDISLVSTLGKGSTFKIEIPLA